ncbi:MAG: hypothetical protein ISR65_11935 [Bacteriovoracaceae bacterium]|nr:hypothetical protein [Bacteriovoracaceae bacterium]
MEKFREYYDIKTYKEILSIATPAIFGFLGLILFEFIDIFWIGKISSKAVAAAGAVAFL